jgi:hypothetical protein
MLSDHMTTSSCSYGSRFTGFRLPCMHDFPDRIIYCDTQCHNNTFTARLLHGLDELFGLHFVMNIDEKKYGPGAIGRVTATSCDVIRRRTT